MLNKWLLFFTAGVVSYLLLRAMSAFLRRSSDYEKEIEQILTSDKNKVKGRFEE